MEYTYEHLPYRGLTKDTLKTYDIKTKIDAEGKPVSVGFTMPNGDIKVRELAGKKFHWLPGADLAKAGLFGRDKFSAGSHKYVTITEGYEDAASIHQVCRGPVVSIHSSSSAVSDVSVDYSFLNSFERIYLAFDGDEPGRAATAKVAKLFDYNKVYDVKFGGGRKDANDYLQRGEVTELYNIWWNAKRYLPDTIKSSFTEFRDILSNPVKVGVSYPWPTLSEMTKGIRTGESVLITAMEGVGKTEIMHAIEHKLLKETDYNVGSIYIEEPEQRHLQAIAGIELQRPVHLPDSGCTNDQVIAALEEVVGRDERLHVYSHYGSDDADVLLDTIRFLVVARGCRVVLFDHITMAVSGLAGDDERRALDYLSTRLEMMVKELDFALILVSHVNDLGLTRGSRNISKIADVRIDAKRDLLAADDRSRRTIELQISKNRPAWQTGPAGSLLFNPSSYTLMEVAGGQDEGRAFEIINA